MKTKQTELTSFWQKHFNQFSTSKLSQAAYCREHGLKAHLFYYHYSRINKKSTDNHAFSRVVICDKSALEYSRPLGTRLLCAGGLILEIEPGADPKWLANLIGNLGGRA